MNARAFVIAFAIGASACASNPIGPNPVRTINTTRFVAFGDSLTQGVTTSLPSLTALDAGVPVSYPYKLQDMLRERFTEQTPMVFNGGFAGEQAVAALPRLRTVLDEAQAQALLLLHGANDLNGGPGRIEPTLDAIRLMIVEARGRNMTVFVATQPPQCTGGTPPRGGAATFLPQFNDPLKEMAQAEGAVVVDLYAGFDLSLQGPDCLHPTDAGYTRIAEIFRSRILDVFERRARAR